MKRLLLLGYGEMGPFALEGLSAAFQLLGVVTPPAGANRFRTDAVRRTEDLAGQRGIPVHHDPSLDGLHELVLRLQPEAVVICSYDKILPARTLRATKAINVHHGDLPRYRGRANLNWAIINGRDQIGVTVHEVVPDLDAGRIYQTWMLPIGEETYIADLYQSVNQKILRELPPLVQRILDGAVAPTPQQGTPTYCCTRLPEDGQIDWTWPAPRIRSLIRGVSKPFGGAFSLLTPGSGAPQRVTIWRADLEATPRVYEGNVPGRVARILKGRGVEVLTGSTPLIITEVGLNGTDCRADEVIKSTASTFRQTASSSLVG